MQRERMKRAKTMSEPTKIPMTTHSLRPKIEVGFDSSVSTNAASYTDIFFFFSLSLFCFVFCLCMCVFFAYVCVKESEENG